MFVGHSGLVQAISALVVIGIVTYLATKIGKRRAFYVSTGISMIGYTLKWFCYTPDNPWLVLIPAPLMAFGLAGLFTLMPSMVADVVDADELNTHERREGMYGSIFWWVVKLGQSAAILGGGLLLVWVCWRLYREIGESHMQRASFERLLAGLSRAGIVQMREDSFDKGKEHIVFQRVDLLDTTVTEAALAARVVFMAPPASEAKSGRARKKRARGKASTRRRWSPRTRNKKPGRTRKSKRPARRASKR